MTDANCLCFVYSSFNSFVKDCCCAYFLCRRFYFALFTMRASFLFDDLTSTLRVRVKKSLQRDETDKTVQTTRSVCSHGERRSSMRWTNGANRLAETEWTHFGNSGRFWNQDVAGRTQLFKYFMIYIYRFFNPACTLWAALHTVCVFYTSG